MPGFIQLIELIEITFSCPLAHRHTRGIFQCGNIADEDAHNNDGNHPGVKQKVDHAHHHD